MVFLLYGHSWLSTPARSRRVERRSLATIVEDLLMNGFAMLTINNTLTNIQEGSDEGVNYNRFEPPN
jgi:hypothetical protein